MDEPVSTWDKDRWDKVESSVSHLLDLIEALGIKKAGADYMDNYPGFDGPEGYISPFVERMFGIDECSE